MMNQREIAEWDARQQEMIARQTGLDRLRTRRLALRRAEGTVPEQIEDVSEETIRRRINALMAELKRRRVGG